MLFRNQKAGRGAPSGNQMHEAGKIEGGALSEVQGSHIEARNYPETL